MKNTLKLKPKQLAVIQEIQFQRSELMKRLTELNRKENQILEIIFEQDGTEGTISGVKLVEDTLEYEITEPTKTE